MIPVVEKKKWLCKHSNFFQGTKLDMMKPGFHSEFIFLQSLCSPYHNWLLLLKSIVYCPNVVLSADVSSWVIAKYLPDPWYPSALLRPVGPTPSVLLWHEIILWWRNSQRFNQMLVYMGTFYSLGICCSFTELGRAQPYLVLIITTASIIWYRVWKKISPWCITRVGSLPSPPHMHPTWWTFITVAIVTQMLVDFTLWETI